jgi:predicted protein tyrosine phosphatase
VRLIICPLAQLDAALALAPSHVLTLLAPGAEIPSCPTIALAGRLVLRFNDINGPAEGLTHASRKDIETLIAFARSWRGPAPFVAHCWAGISRSTAGAYVAACALNPGRDELAIAWEIRRASRTAQPNVAIVSIADRLLKRDGRMMRAIETIGPGHLAAEGDPFRLDIA